jgi:hypothetical protein
MDCAPTTERESQDLQRLLSARELVGATLQACAPQLRRLHASKPVLMDDIIKISMQIRYNMHAPREFKVGCPLVNGHPPAPQPEEMRNSVLSSYNQKHNAAQATLQSNDGERPGLNFVAKLEQEMEKFQELKRRRQLVTEMNVDASAAMEGREAESDLITFPSQAEEPEQTQQEAKKARTVNLSFASFDDSDNEDD